MHEIIEWLAHAAGWLFFLIPIAAAYWVSGGFKNMPDGSSDAGQDIGPGFNPATGKYGTVVTDRKTGSITGYTQ